MQIQAVLMTQFHVADIGLSIYVEQELPLEFSQLTACNSADFYSKLFATATVFCLQTVSPRFGMK